MTTQALETPVLRTAGRRAVPVLAGAGFVVFWSCGFIGARWGTAYSSAFNLLAWRFVLAGTVATALLLIRRPRITRTDVITQAAMALLTQCIYLGLIFTGIDHGISAGVTALIGSLQPILIATVAGVLATGGGWSLYLVNLRLFGATRVSSMMYLVPPTTMVFAFLLFDETAGLLALGGMLVCATAVLLIRLGSPQQNAA